ncbi:hypothetical protein FOMA001_g12991 [Fusarium oxysporum f. sp. matthiolae]|nr:hypothetical protein FOMA001_g12991 [Fusarium oxysporum f. sp. matthiolae]
MRQCDNATTRTRKQELPAGNVDGPKETAHRYHPAKPQSKPAPFLTTKTRLKMVEDVGGGGLVNLHRTPDWEARGNPDAHFSIAGTHTSSQDIDQAAFNSPSPSPSPSHTLTRPQPPAKKAVRKRKTSSGEPLAPKRLQVNLKPALDQASKSIESIDCEL